MADLAELHAEEYRLFCRYNEAVRGDDAPGMRAQVSPKRVREKRAAWHDAMAAIKAAGYGSKDVRAMLQERGREAARKGN